MSEFIETKVTYDYIGRGHNFKKKYYVEIIHNGLNEHRTFTGTDLDILNNKSSVYIQKLNEKWDKHLDKVETRNSKEELLEEATTLAKEAQQDIKEVENILQHTLNINDEIDWNNLKNYDEFKVPNPEFKLDYEIKAIGYKPTRRSDKPLPPPPIESIFHKGLTIMDRIFPSRKKVKLELENEAYENACRKWEEDCRQVEENNKSISSRYLNDCKDYEENVKKVKEKIQIQVQNWENEKANYYSNQKLLNSKIDLLKKSYFNSEWDAIIEHTDLVLSNSNYPHSFPKEWDIEYNQDTKSIILDYSLPTYSCLPKIYDVRVIRGELKEYYLSEIQLAKLFESTIYQITLRTIHEIFEADSISAIEQITFNGWVDDINKATGRAENNCILSVQVKKSEFINIDLSNIDPKICFKNLKGISSSKLVNLTPVKPIIQISKNDNRFTSHYDVADSLDNSINLASMDWEDFEHLIREIFSKEFSVNGGEVRVTQASRDGGVDAIAFDPDPIRGGKIVIQAKRYTNTVGVSAVRDLYGTIMNEGATKGILVTTSDYGPDSYQFANGKPITLMNGANLLYLLEKHGHSAKIDIKEARLNR
jgi:restriction system protein